ncbi:hypothetical protein ACHAXT_000015 [Thalassiosira profunda]
MGLFSKNKPDSDFDVEASQPPLVTATPIPANYAAGSLPTPAQAASNAKIAAAVPSAPPQPTQQSQSTSFPAGLWDTLRGTSRPLGRHPANVLCPNCNKESVTRTSTYPGWETWVLCGLIALIFWPAFWVPLVMDTLKTTEHVCSGCGVAVGQVKPLTDCCVKERPAG